MPFPARLSQLLVLLAVLVSSPFSFAAGKQTVCTITINSADEAKAFRKFLPADKYDFVELVEKGRPDWLASACQQKVSCDIVVVSGHHGEGNVFFSDAFDIREFLPIEELERVSCSNSCPNLFANLKEVHLYGCNTLNTEAQQTITPAVARSYVREGRQPMDAAQLAKRLGLQRGESSRDRMRMVFPNVPVIYGFSGVAPLGPVAAVSLNRYFQTAGASEVGKGHTSSRLLGSFAQHGMVATRGIAAGDPLTPVRKDICSFADDGTTEARKVDAVHEILRRPAAESRMLLDRIEKFVASLGTAKRQKPEIAQALERVARDADARERFLAFARDADQFPVRARMIDVSHDLGWLTADARQAELVKMMGELLARKDIAAAEVNLACTLNKDRLLDGTLAKASNGAESTGQSAVQACMGSGAARERVLKALVSPVDADVQVAQAYLRNHPIADAAELRTVTKAIAAMDAPEAQVRALDTLGRHYLSDPESMASMKELFARTRSAAVQNAIAGVLIRADRSSVAAANMLPTLREHGLQAPKGENLVNSLIARLQQTS